MISVRRLAIVTALAAVTPAFLMHSKPANAQAAVLCVNCSTIVEQALQLAEEVTTAIYQVRAYQTMVQNLLTIPGANFSNVVGDLTQIQALLNNGSLQAAQISQIISRLQSAAAENNIALNLPQNYQMQFAQWQSSLANSSLAMQQQLQLAPQKQIANAQTLDNAQADLANAQGNLQAIQASGEISAAGVNAMMQMHDSLIAYLQSAQTQFATTNERTAVGDQAVANFIAPPYAAVTLNGYSSSGQ